MGEQGRQTSPLTGSLVSPGFGEEGRKTTGALLVQVLLTDPRTRTAMCSSLTLTPCCRLPTTQVTQRGPTPPAPGRSAAVSPKVTRHLSSSAPSQASPTPSATEPCLILCSANTTLFLSHHPSSQRAQGSLQLLTQPVPVLKVPLRGNMLLPLDATQNQGQGAKRDVHTCRHESRVAPGKPYRCGAFSLFMPDSSI